MRSRTLLLVLVVVVLGAFAALNLNEFMRMSELDLGFTRIQASLPLILLSLLLLASIVYLGTMFYLQSSHLRENRRLALQLNSQRELADKAEASRFTELRSYLEVQALAAQQREVANGTVLAERFAQQQQAVIDRLEQSDNRLAAYMGQLEERLEHLSQGRPMPERSRINVV